jgi:hypothetical protein
MAGPERKVIEGHLKTYCRRYWGRFWDRIKGDNEWIHEGEIESANEDEVGGLREGHI